MKAKVIKTKKMIEDGAAEIERQASWVRAVLDGLCDYAIIAWHPDLADAMPDFWSGDEDNP